MFDPFVDGATAPAGRSGGGGAPVLRREQQAADRVRPIFRSLRLPGRCAGEGAPVAFAQRWSAWGASFGGNNMTTAIRRSARPTSRRATTAMPRHGLSFLAGHGGGLRACRRRTNWGLARGSAAAAAMRSRPASTARAFGPVHSARRLPSPILVHHQPQSRSAISSRRASTAKLWRPRRGRLSLSLATERWHHALRRRAGADLPHPELQRERSDRRRLRAGLRAMNATDTAASWRAVRQCRHARRHAARPSRPRRLGA